MRKLVPYIGIAVAVAIGIAVAPFVWWIVGAVLALAALGVAFLALGFVVLLLQRIRAYVMARVSEAA